MNGDPVEVGCVANGSAERSAYVFRGTEQGQQVLRAQEWLSSGWRTGNCEKYGTFSADSFPRRSPLPHGASTHSKMLQNEGLQIRTEAVSPLAGYCEHGDVHSGSVIWRNLFTVCVTISFLRKSGIKFHFTSLHTCTIQLNSSPLLCMTCWCVIFFQRTVYVADNWAGRFWARTGCNFNRNGQCHCVTGDCGNKLQCNDAGGVPPVTLAQVSLNGADGKDFYDVSLVDGFNIPVQVRRFLG